MQIVINIPENTYEQIIEAGDMDYLEVITAIENGIVLPKGHGRLKDADAILAEEKPRGLAEDTWKESHLYKILTDAPTIIEEDKENKNDNFD